MQVAVSQLPAHRPAIVALIRRELRQTGAGPAPAHVVVLGRSEGRGQREAVSLDDERALRPLATVAHANSTPHFFAGTKLPSRNAWLHWRRARVSRLVRRAWQMRVQTPLVYQMTRCCHWASVSLEDIVAPFLATTPTAI